jgi:hypothetical protein
MRRRSVIIFLLILLLLVAILFVVLYMLEDRDVEVPDGDSGESGETNYTGTGDEDPGSGVSTGGGASTSGATTPGGGSSSGSGSGENGGGEVQLPDDIDQKPCGFYVSEYAVCAGLCPSGTCQQEGNSCYCKI